MAADIQGSSASSQSAWQAQHIGSDWLGAAGLAGSPTLLELG